MSRRDHLYVHVGKQVAGRKSRTLVEIKLRPRPGRRPGIVRQCQDMMGTGARKPPPSAPRAELQGSLWWFIKIVSILLVIVAPAFFTSCVQKHIFSDIHTRRGKMWFVETAWYLEDNALCLLSL